MTPWTAAHQVSQSFITFWTLLKFVATELVMLSNHLILCYSLLPLTSFFPSIRIFSNESALHIRWPKYWSSSFSISPSNELFRVDFLYDWPLWSPCSVGDSLKSSQTWQFKSISASVFSLLYGSTLTSIHAAAAAAKLLQWCPTLCPPGSAVPGILQARALEWVTISFSKAWKWKVKGKTLSRVHPLATPWTAARAPRWQFSVQIHHRGPLATSPRTQQEKQRRSRGSRAQRSVALVVWIHSC